MKAPHQLSDIELSEYADEHIAYELDMLRWSGSLLYAYNIASLRGSPLEGPLAQPVANALVESFAVHTRNLIDFLYLRNHYGKDRSTDIVVEDYVDGDTLSMNLPRITQLLQNAKKKADKQVAHLASERLRYGPLDKSWFYTQILSDITIALAGVVPYIPLSRVGRLLPQLVSSDTPSFISLSGEHIRSSTGNITGISFFLDVEQKS